MGCRVTLTALASSAWGGAAARPAPRTSFRRPSAELFPTISNVKITRHHVK
ncbi:hypothetical protein FAGKG844_100110 [Frankia sp. AgKG'84/4]